MNTLEGRLTAELRAESELITPESIPALSLPVRNRGPRLLRGRLPGWLTPLAAAAAVLAIVAGALTLPRVISSGAAPRPGTSGARLPRYYAVAVSGNVVTYSRGNYTYASEVLGATVQIRVTGTGRLVTTVRPAPSYSDFMVLTATPDGATFVFGAERYWGFHGTGNPLTGALDTAAPVRFTMLRITPDGHAHLSALSVPVTILPGQQPSIALSPDGTKLAVAYGGAGQPALLRIVTLATGQMSQWQWPRVSWTPQLQGIGTWTADGRTLLLQQSDVVRGEDTKLPMRDSTASVWLVPTDTPGNPGTQLDLHAPAGQQRPDQPYLTPDGSELLATAGTGTDGVPPRGRSSGEIAVYSARTGALIRTLAPWTWSVAGAHGNPFPMPDIAWSDPAGSRLLVLLPHDGLNRLAEISGGGLTLTGGLLPGNPAAYADLQAALLGGSSVPPHMTW